jgi:hypothetical protein
MSYEEKATTNKVWSIGIAVALLIVVIASIGSVIETLDSTEEMVIQYPSGKLVAATEPGIYAQWFGSVTKYPLRSQFSFSSSPTQGDTTDESVIVRFNDGGHANVSGVNSWVMPINHDQLINIHRQFGSPKAIEQQIIRPTIESAAYTSGPLMSSTESAAEKRNLLLQYMQDQAKNGPYQTRTVSLKVIDPLTQTEKTVNAAEIVIGSDGKPVRENESAATIFGIKLLPMTINRIKYDDIIEKQITQRQASIQGVQIAQANALKAEQDAITAAKQGEANAATAKWTQEALKATEVTKAEQEAAVANLNAERDLNVAKLAAQQAEQYKQEQILEGQGDATKKKLIMDADGALNSKLDAYVKIQEAYADAISKYTGAWVPTYISGGTGNTVSGSGAQQLIDMLSIKTARDLGLDMSVQGQDKTK